MSNVHVDGSRTGSEPAAFDDLSRAILTFESEWPKHTGDKEDAMRVRLSLEPARYYQLLGRLVDDPAAQAHAPLLIGRLRRLREARSARRARMLR
ncbi:DUF3263 domain-containing protein [Microbacterium karelineae]|uniref:DUF3263 domain-containing protein n=1 Tax=Microbacterium karelineae TaxID=2654283 RepID=UPI0012EA7F57|nr:DUF3263 domain-containing protein [Microbacterium karelineae]